MRRASRLPRFARGLLLLVVAFGAAVGLVFLSRGRDGLPARPKLRDVYIKPVQSDAGVSYYVTDPEAYGREGVMLGGAAVSVLRLLDGTRTLREVEDEIVRATKDARTAEGFRSLVAKLNDNYFFEGPRFDARKAQVHDAFGSSPIRAAAHAGIAYPRDGFALRSLLAGAFEEARKSRPKDLPRRSPRGLIVPHIEPVRGGACTAAAFQTLTGAAPPRLVVLFGTVHAGVRVPLVFTRKSFETPLGRVGTEIPVVERLAGVFGEGAFSDEDAHRREHSLEYPILYLQHVYAAAPWTLVPILVGPPLDASRTRVEGRVAAVAAEISRLVAERGGEVLLVSSGDLSHVGLRFGDATAPDARRKAEVTRYERTLLEALEAASVEKLLSTIVSANDSFRVCGTPADLLLLLSGRFERGRVLCHRQFEEGDSGSLVSSAAVALW